MSVLLSRQKHTQGQQGQQGHAAPPCQLPLLYGVCLWEKPPETRSRPWDRQQPWGVPCRGREARADQTGSRLPLLNR